MAQVDRSKEALNNLNNKVDQKLLAKQNRFLRWLCVAFVIALGLTLLFYPHVSKEGHNETDSQILRDYSGATVQRLPSRVAVFAVSNARYDQVSTAAMYRF